MDRLSGLNCGGTNTGRYKRIIEKIDEERLPTMTRLWITVSVVIEVMAILSWLAGTATRQVKFTFLFGFNVMLPVAYLHLSFKGYLDWRDVLAMSSVVLYLLDMNVVILFWTQNTAMSKLDRHLRPVEKQVLPFLMTNAVGWLYCLPFYYIARRAGPLDWKDIAALIGYLVGMIVHVIADWQKKRFKARPETKGQLLDKGFWRYSRHPNYFGDMLTYVGWALFAASPWAWLSPATNLAQYTLDAIPQNERWAADRYGQAWASYAARTSRLILWLRHRGHKSSD